MANQNLSQFTEKTFVADADWVFVWDTVGAISKKVSRNNWLNSGTLTADAPVTISQTWDALAVAFTALKVNAVSTASASASLLLDLQVGTVSQFSVTKSGALTALGSAYVGALNVGNGIGLSTAGGHIRASNGIAINLGVSDSTSTDNFANLFLRSSALISFGGNTKIQRDGADNTLALRNGAAAQTFNVYGTSSSSNTVYERMFAKYNGTDLAFQIGTETANATLRPLDFVTGGSRRMTIGTTGNVGIGTTAPTVPLEVVSATAVQIIARSGTGLTSGAYFAAIGQQESYFNVTTNSNASGSRNMRFGNSSANTFVVQALSDDALSILRTPLSISNAAPTGSLHILSSGNVGIGTTAPSSKLQVSAGDVEVDTIAKGVILKSPDGTRYRVTVANGGTLSVAAV